jgi:acyl carrier protein
MSTLISRDETADAAHIPVIRSYIAENILLGQDQELKETASLYDSGVLDSTAIMELVAFLESHFGIEIQDEDLTESNLGSIASTARFVERKLNKLAVESRQPASPGENDAAGARLPA